MDWTELCGKFSLKAFRLKTTGLKPLAVSNVNGKTYQGLYGP